MTTQTISGLFDLSGRVAIVTGGAVGIGRAICLRLAEAGASVVIADLDSEAAGRTVERIEAGGGRASAIRADVRRTADAKKVAGCAVSTFGSLDILVNNAGIYPLAPVMQVTEALWDDVLNTNLKGTFFYAQAAAERMIEAGNGGRIVNLASIDGLHPHGSATHYNASKGGVVMVTKALALELARHGITVNAVAPGSIITEGTTAMRQTLEETAGIDAREVLDRFVKRIPLRRHGQPDDIARVVLFLASPAADYLTGELILADGGFLLS